MSRTFHHHVRFGKRHFFKLSNKIGPTPGWFVREFMTRPKRRLTRRIVRSILAGRDPDGVAFPLGGRRPHVYFW